MSYCGQATTVNCRSHEIVAAKLKCKRWSCAECYPDQCRKVARQALAGEPDLFVTLTVNPAFGEGPNDRAAKLRDAWRIIRRRAIVEAARPWTQRPGWKQWAIAWKGYAKDSPTFRNRVRLHNGRLPFTVSIEETEAGEPHLHILSRAEWLDWRWLKAQLEELTGAWVIDVQRIKDPKHVAHYVAKYIGKGPAKFPGLKRHWRSRDYIVVKDEDDDPPPADDGIRWRHNMTLEAYIAPFQAGGYFVDYRGNSAVIRPP